MTEDAPAYQWFVKDWRSSRAGQRMSFAERGVYREMLDEQWERRTLPDDPEAVAELIATTEMQRAEVIAAWPVVRRKFITTDDGQIQNARLERCRKEFRAYLREKKKGGKARAASAIRAGNGAFQASSGQPAASQQPPSSRQADIQPSSASATATASSSATATAEGARRAAGAPPLSLGLRRLKVWRWMLDDCIGALGDHAEAFDIEAWLQVLDAREKNVVPEMWPWLKNELMAEARRRGLPMVATSDRKPMFNQSTEEMGKAVLATLKRETGLPR